MDGTPIRTCHAKTQSLRPAVGLCSRRHPRPSFAVAHCAVTRRCGATPSQAAELPPLQPHAWLDWPPALPHVPCRHASKRRITPRTCVRVRISARVSGVCATRQSSSYASGAHRKRIAQAQAVTVGRARASDWSGSAATGREPPSNPWRGIMATGVARTGETRDAVCRARPIDGLTLIPGTDTGG